MAEVANLKTKDGFDKNEVINFALENLKKRNPSGNLKKNEVEEKINSKIEEILTRSGKTPVEMGRYLANFYGRVHPHFVFDRYRPFTSDEIEKYHLQGKTDIEMIKALNKIRMKDRKRERAQWEIDRGKEVASFRRYFMDYLERSRGPHKENALGVKVQVGDDIEIVKGHYSKIY